jgi:DNA polymerase
MTALELHADFETRSTIDLKKTGSHIYAKHHTTDIWCLGYAFGDEPVEVWVPPWVRADVPKEPFPERIISHVRSSGIIKAHNAAFERVIWRFVLGPRYGIPVPEIRQFRCTMAMAAAMSLPHALGQVAKAVGLADNKDMDGHRLMMQLAKPRRPRKGEDPDQIYWWDDDREKVLRHIEYCRQDVVVERAVDGRLYPLSESEQELWFLDQEINERGFHIDRATVVNSIYVAQDSSKALNREINKLTEGEVPTLGSNAKLLAWIQGRGYGLDSVGATALENFVEKNDLFLDEVTRSVIELRREGAATSIRKLDSMLARADIDDRVRGNYKFHGAGTGRWSGEGVQTQNMVRAEVKNVAELVRALSFRNADWIDIVHGMPIQIIKKMMRSMIMASPGHDYIAADFNNVEGRGIAWLAGDDEKLDAFRKIDTEGGADIYMIAAGGIYHKDPTLISKDERQIGKVSELACGYQGGVGAFQSMASVYRVQVPDDQAKDIVDAWREAHPEIRAYWYDLEEAAFAAVRDTGSRYGAGPKDHRRIIFRVVNNILMCKLPSTRVIMYPDPKIKDMIFCRVDGQMTTVLVEDIPKLIEAGKEITDKGEPSPVVTYMSVNQYTRRWERTQTYGGKLSENITQAAARDLMADAMKRLTQENYPIVMHVHDECVSEVLQDEGDLAKFEEIMSAVPTWADGFPLVAKGWRGLRYKKD